MSETADWADTVGQRESVGERTVRLALDWPIPSMSSDGVRSEDVMGVVEHQPPAGPHSALHSPHHSQQYLTISHSIKELEDFLILVT